MVHYTKFKLTKENGGRTLTLQTTQPYDPTCKTFSGYPVDRYGVRIEHSRFEVIDGERTEVVSRELVVLSPADVQKATAYRVDNHYGWLVPCE